MTTTQTPADIKLLPLPASSYGITGRYDEADMRAYALVCVEADRKERVACAPYEEQPDGTIIPIDLEEIAYKAERIEQLENSLLAEFSAHEALKQSLAQPAQAAVPEGWKLMPIEPTTEMVDAANRIEQRHNTRIYTAMLNAAPEREGGV